MSSNSSNQPHQYPLQGAAPRYDFKLLEPESALVDMWLPKEEVPTQAHTQTPGQEQSLPSKNIDSSGMADSSVVGPDSGNRKRMWALGEDEESTGTESCDDMLASDTDTNSMVSNNGSMLALLRENRLNHPPKRRLMTSEAVNEAILNIASNNGNTANNSNTASHAPAAANHSSVSSTNNTLLTSTATTATSGEVTVPRTPTAFNSPSSTISETEEEDIALGVEIVDNNPSLSLPLPSPSASPVSTYNKDMTPIGNDWQLIPTTTPRNQAELLDLIVGLSTYLNGNNRNHLIFKLLQNVKRSTLSSFNDVIRSSLKRDLISNLPVEITYNILKNLDYKTVCSLSRVCSNWHRILSNTGIWAHLLKRDKLVSGDQEIEKELRENKAELLKWSTMPDSSNVNLTQLLFKKRRIILNRWMDPKYEPKRISVRGHISIPGHESDVVTCLQHDDEKIITGVADKLINIYSTKTGKLLKVLKGHEGGVWALKYTGNTLVSGSTDRTVRVWNIKTGKCTQVFRGHTSTVRCLDILHPTKIGTDDNGEDIIFPQTPLLVTGSRDHNLHVWKLPLVDENEGGDGNPSDDNSEPIEIDVNNSSSGSDIENPYLVAILTGHTHSVRSVSGYGNIIVSGSYDTTVRVWDLLDGGKCKQIFAGHQDRIYSTALDFKNKRCYSGSMDATINVWDFEHGKLLYTLEGHGSLVGLLELSEEYLVSAAADATLRVWNPDSGKNLSKLEGHSAAITCFQHDNLRIVSGSERMLKLWDINSGKFVRDLLADITGGIWQVRFDYCRCVAAVQRSKNENDETFIEIVDFSTPPSSNESKSIDMKIEDA